MKYKYLGRYNPPQEVVRIVRWLIDNKIYRSSEKERMFEKVLKDLCEYFKIEVPKFVYKEDIYCYKLTGGGCFEPPSTIKLFKCSIITFLHEFVHYLEFTQKGETDEESPRLFSVNVFAQVSPSLFWKAVKNKKIFYV